MSARLIEVGKIIGAGKVDRRNNAAVLFVIVQAATYGNRGRFTRHRVARLSGFG